MNLLGTMENFSSVLEQRGGRVDCTAQQAYMVVSRMRELRPSTSEVKTANRNAVDVDRQKARHSDKRHHKDGTRFAILKKLIGALLDNRTMVQAKEMSLGAL